MAMSPAAYWGGFAVAKAGVEALVKIQAQEWEMLPNLRINVLYRGRCIHPQRTRTHPGEVKQSLTPAGGIDAKLSVPDGAG